MSNSDDDIPLSVKLNKTNINKLSTPQSSNGGASKIAKPIKNGNGNGTAKHTNGAENLDSDDDMPLIARTKSAKPIAKKDSLKKATTTAKAKVTKAKAAKDSPAKKAETRARAPKSDFENGWSEAKADPSVPYRAPSSSVNSTPAKRKTQIKNESDDEVFETPTKSKKSSAKSTPKITPKGKVKKEEKEVDLKEEEEEEEYKWWEANAANEDETVKWVTLHHNGVLFPPPYEPHGVKMLYDGEPITLVPEVEEAVTFFAAIMQLDHANNTVFQKNFMKDLLKVIKKSKTPCPIKEFKKCNFTPIYEHLQREREERLSKTKEEKLKIKLEKDAIAEPFMWALLDGRKEKVGNFNVEPPSLFKGRGDHPKTGCIKARIQPEDVTLNLSKDAPIPPAPKGHKWGKIVHSNTSTWLANWTDSITGSGKYVFLSHDSSLKGQSDLKKFEVARKLKTYIKDIRKQYTRNLKSDDMKNKQLATAMYLIDVLAIRAGNEKGEDEADTVGCCSLRLEHIELITPNTLKFDFLGKDSIRYINEVEVSPQVFKNMKELRKGKKKSDMLFDLLNTSYLNNHLKKLMPGLTAKVFRTYNASHTFQEQLKNTNPNDSEVLKLQSFNRANRQVAILCNHQKTVSKNFDTQMEKQEDRIRAIKLDIKRVKGSILASDKKLVKSYPELEEPESDLDDDWCREFIKNKYQDAREKSKVKFEVKNEQLESNNEETVPQSKLQSQLDSYDEKESQMLNEIDTGKYEKVSDPEKLITRWQKLNESLLKQKTVKTEKDENKATALGTSKTNYIDPRITVAWSKRFGVPLERLFPKTLLTKFQWATTVDEDFIF